MPTKHRRIAITETPPVKEALDELRRELDGKQLPLAEVIELGARAKTEELRRERAVTKEGLERLAQAVLDGMVPGDPEAAEEVRRTGWIPHT